MKVLILKPSSLGDVVQALPVLRSIKGHHPGSEIYWWIDSQLAPLLEDDPALAGVVRFDRRRWAAPRNWLALAQSVLWMRRQQFDWVIDLQSLARSGSFAWLANGKLTVGLDESREGARGFYDVIVPRPSYDTHAVEWYLRVLPALGVPARHDFDWIPQRPRLASAIRQKWPIQNSRWIALQPGARWQNKRWPAENFSELVKRLSPTYDDVRFAILGGEEDRALGQSIAQAGAERCLNLAGQLSLPEMVEWIRACELMVTNDTGPMHVAAALGRPVVAIFGPTDPRRTGPYGQLTGILQTHLTCVPCMKPRCSHDQPLACLWSVTAAEVAARVGERLKMARALG